MITFLSERIRTGLIFLFIAAFLIGAFSFLIGKNRDLGKNVDELMAQVETLSTEKSTLEKEKGGLEEENKVLAEEAAAWMCRYREIQNFLGEMEPGIEKLEAYSRCDNCCDIGEKIEKMGPGFIHWLARIVILKFAIIAWHLN
jgi:FtsZ-binding cell division protein ZapB